MKTYNTLTLSNGLRIIHTPSPTSVAYCGYAIDAGTRDEQPHEAGLAHFVEHMLFKGTKTRTSYDIACGFDKIGGNVNAFTERECICVHCVVPAQFLNDALAIFLS